MANGEPDTKLHGLSNADDFLETCKAVKHSAILCGHIHRTYHIDLKDLNTDLYCTDSATMEGHEGFWVYEVAKKEMKATLVFWDKETCTYRF